MLPSKPSHPPKSAERSEQVGEVSTQPTHPEEQKENAPPLAPYISPSDQFYSEEGRAALYNDWLRQQITEGKIDPAKLYSREE